MKEVLEVFSKNHSDSYLFVVSQILQKMSSEEILSLPAIRMDDAERKVAENYGYVFSIMHKGKEHRFYSFGYMPYRIL